MIKKGQMFCIIAILLTSSVIVADEIIVDHAGTGSFTTIQAAIDSPYTNTGDTVIVKPGTYFENIDLKGKAIILRSSDPNNPEIVNSTIIDGNEIGTVISCINGEIPDTVIAGFVITHGKASYGGGMYNYNSSPTIKNCSFIRNDADDGAGIYNRLNSDPIISNCKFIDNTAITGGGINNYYSSPKVQNCTFKANFGILQGWGGGISNTNSDPIVINCIFIDNASYSGGGIENYKSSPTITNCIFVNNWGVVDGGGMYNNDSSVFINNCTFINNATGYEGNYGYGGGLFNYYSSPFLNNCILWQNEDQIFNYDSSGNPVFSYSNIENSFSGGSWDTALGVNGGGNIDVAPLFVDIDGDDNIIGTVDDNLQLQADSPCIDAGNNLIAPLDSGDIDNDGITAELLPVDLAGNNRFADDPDTFDTGISSAGADGVIDMGAYEYAVDIEIEGDVNSDGDVDVYDLGKFAGQWLYPTCNKCYVADFNDDGDVNLKDFVKLAKNWQLGTYSGNEGDLDEDGDVDMDDLEKIAISWLYPICNNCYDGDINEDGDVNFEDFAKLARNWLLGTN